MALPGAADAYFKGGGGTVALGGTGGTVALGGGIVGLGTMVLTQLPQFGLISENYQPVWRCKSFIGPAPFSTRPCSANLLP